VLFIIGRFGPLCGLGMMADALRTRPSHENPKSPYERPRGRGAEGPSVASPAPGLMVAVCSSASNKTAAARARATRLGHSTRKLKSQTQLINCLAGIIKRGALRPPFGHP
jgi:hypothetical protein